MASLYDIQSATDHFALFGLPRGFDLDRSRLESAYLQLARLTHPDFAGADPESQAQAMELSARVNEAYRILSDDLLRGVYLLEGMGESPGEGDQSLPDGFLESILELREELQSAQEIGNVTAVVRIETRLGELRLQYVTRIAEFFRQSGPVAEIRRQLNALRYIQRTLDSSEAG